MYIGSLYKHSNLLNIIMESISVENLKQNKNKTMLIRLSAIKKSQIDSVADELGLSTSAFVRLSVDNFIKGLD